MKISGKKWFIPLIVLGFIAVNVDEALKILKGIQ